MTLTIQRRKSEYVYKIEPDEPNQIWVRRNMHNMRWRKYGPPFASAETATESLLKLERGTDTADSEVRE